MIKGAYSNLNSLIGKEKLHPVIYATKAFRDDGDSCKVENGVRFLMVAPKR